MSLTEAIETAVKETSVDPIKPEETVKPQKEETEAGSKDDESSDESSEEEEEDSKQESDLSDDELAEAKDLYKALKDPNSSKAVIAALAERTGLNKVDTPKEVKESKKSIQQMLENALGTEFKFLADKLGPAITEILNEEKEERNAQFQRIEAQKIESEVIGVFNELAKRTNGDSKKLESKMMEIAKDILPGPDTSVKTYVNRLYTIANAGQSNTNPKKVIDTIKKNANDTSGRLRAAAGGNSEHETKPPGNMKLNDSVEWALKQIQAGKR